MPKSASPCIRVHRPLRRQLRVPIQIRKDDRKPCGVILAEVVGEPGHLAEYDVVRSSGTQTAAGSHERGYGGSFAEGYIEATKSARH